MAVFKLKFDTDQDYYAILGVSPQDPIDRVKNAYRQLARKFHPDAGEGADPYKFDEAAKAWAVLSDPKKRRYYDRCWKKKHPAAPKSSKGSPSPSSKDAAARPRPSPPATDWSSRVDEICRQAEKHGPFKEAYLETLIRIQKAHGIDTREARQKILDHWMEGLKGLFGAQANLRESYLSELSRMESTYGVDAGRARIDVLDAWTKDLKRMILEQMTGPNDKWPQILRPARDYGYDVKRPRMAVKNRPSKRPSFGEMLAKRMR